MAPPKKAATLSSEHEKIALAYTQDAGNAFSVGNSQYKQAQALTHAVLAVLYQLRASQP